MSGDTITILTTKGDLLATKVISWSQVANAPQTQGYGNARHFNGTEAAVSNIDELSALVTRLQSASQSFVIRGSIAPGTDRATMLRRLHDKPGAPATIIPTARHWVGLDIDSLKCPDHIDPVHDIEEVVEFVVSKLPPEFEGASCHWALTSSAGIKPGIRLRLWFWFDRPLEDWQLKQWLDGYPVDHSVFAPAQPLYTAAPIFKGMPDPCPRRCGLWRGDRDEVTPPAIEKVKRTYTAGGRTSIFPEGSGGGYAAHRARIGDHEGGGGFLAPIKSAVAAWWARHGAATDPAWLRADLENAIREAPRDIGKHPDSYVDTRIADLDPLIAAIRELQAKTEADRPDPESVKPTYSGDGEVSLAEAEQLARTALTGFMGRVEDWNTAPEEERGDPPAMLLNVTLGAGKTHLAAEAIAGLPSGSFVNVLAPDHALGAELTERLCATVGDNHRVLQVLGRDAQHPDGTPMCLVADLAEAVSQLGQSVELHLCRQKNASGIEYCPHHPANPERKGQSCAYQRQKADKEPAIRVGAHAYLSLMKQHSPLPAAHLTVVDENPVEALTRGTDGKPYFVRMVDIDDGRWVRGFGSKFSASLTNDFATYSARLRRVLERPNPTPAMLRAEGLDNGKCQWMLGIWYAQVEPLDVSPSMPRTAKEAGIAAYKIQLALKMGRLWSLLADIIDLETDELRPLRVTEGTDKEGRPEARIEMVWSATPRIEGPTLILDGTGDAEILRRFWPTLGEVRIDVRAEHYHASQITDRAVSRTMLGYNADGMLKTPNPAEEQRARNNRARLAWLAEIAAAQCGAVAVFTYKAVADAIRLEHPQLAADGAEVGFERADKKSAGHFGAVRGLDRWRVTPVAIIAGRLRPDAPEVEKVARAIYFADPRPLAYLPAGERYPTITAGIRMGRGGGCAVELEIHPDPLINGVLDQIRRADLEQTVHRLRLVRRTPENRARVLLLTNVPLNLTVHEATTWEAIMSDVNPASLMLARGVVPEDWPGRAAVVADWLTGDKEPADALRKWFEANSDRNECRRFPYKSSPIGESPTFAAYRYRRAGQRKGAVVHIHHRHQNPRAVAERWLGELDRFELVDATAPYRVVKVEGVTVWTTEDGRRWFRLPTAIDLAASKPVTIDATPAPQDEPARRLPPHFPADPLPPSGFTVRGRPLEEVLAEWRSKIVEWTAKARPRFGFDGCSDFDEFGAEGACA